MSRYCIGRIEEPWVNLTPPIRRSSSRPLNGAPIKDNHTNCGAGTHAVGFAATSLDRSPWRASKGVNETPSSTTDGSHSPTRANIISCTRRGKSSALQESSEEYIARVMQSEIDSDMKKYPSIDRHTQQQIHRKYRALHKQITSEGFYDCPFSEYYKDAVRFAVLFTLFLAALRSGWYMTSAAFLGLFWHQIMFVAHDAGHRGITHNFVVDTLLGMFVGNFCCGLSIGWWKSSHNVHHLIPNHPEHDPDIQNIPLFATCPSFFKSLRSSYYDFTFVWDSFAAFAVRYQVYVYYPIMGIARFNLYLLSIHYLLSKKSKAKGMTAWVRPTELGFIGCYWFLFGYLLLWRSIPTWSLRLAFVLISHVITFALHIQITLSHWGMPTADLGEGESFPQRQLRTTMDIDCPAWMDFIHGGLQFQAVHHLFPRVPRHNLRRLQVLVKEFCLDTGIPYNCLSFVDGNRKVLGRLTEISQHVGMLIECQQYMAETWDSGLH